MKHIIAFLKELKKNNNRDWFNANKEKFQQVNNEFIELIASLLVEMKKFDKNLGTLEAKDCVFRIYNDVRFSKDKSPYKNHFGAWIVKGGKKNNMSCAGYYLHIEPGNSFLGGGSYHPPANELNLIRKEIDYNIKEFKKIINGKEYKKLFPELWEDKLVNGPKGFPKDHPEIELLKFKSYVGMNKINDKLLLSDDFVHYVSDAFRAIHPLNNFLNRALD